MHAESLALALLMWATKHVVYYFCWLSTVRNNIMLDGYHVWSLHIIVRCSQHDDQGFVKLYNSG
jgi:hypothetical protein